MNQNKYDDKLLLKTYEAAKVLGISPQMLRHYVKNFDDNLAIVRTSGNHRRFTKETIEEIREMISFLGESGISIDQLSAIIKTIEIKDIVENTSITGEQDVVLQNKSKKQLGTNKSSDIYLDALDKVRERLEQLILIEKQKAEQLMQIENELHKNNEGKFGKVFRKKTLKE